MDLVLITGAGASRELGRDDQRLPLMPDWSDALCTALDRAESNLADACHLAPGMSGEEFEETLGLLLRWRQVRDLAKRFQGLGGSPVGAIANPVTLAHDEEARRLAIVVDVINQTLYEQFGQLRIDDERAAAAYGALFRELDADWIAVATTNYDRSGEAAVTALGGHVVTGFRSEPGRTPKLDVRGLVADSADALPYLHLHGAVGWYEREGAVFDHQADQPFNQTLGSPVVLYPDPDKDPTSDATVSELWGEFAVALERVDHVMVVGHSLHDPALVQAITDADPRKLAVSVYPGEDSERIRDLLPKAITVGLAFGPDLEIDRAAVAAFRG